MTRSRFLHDLGAELISHGNELLKRSRDFVTRVTAKERILIIAYTPD